ncbi:MAG: HAMP domain-containing protein [Candidatus Tectomicrobia bacterium]|uniref:histidine kinase n=1 Tax=Tectimicrobiota bacterium TaxID=2528274 RepID=A0A932FX48_UNCTE|nr:HAMP domain-containing protein [Candidatus Tectomicrobia bacterium]
MRWRFLWGIKTKLFLFAWTMGILPLVISTVLSSLVISQTLTNRTQGELQTISQVIEQRIDSFLSYRMKMARFWAITPVVILGTPEERTAYFHQILRFYPQYLWIGLTDPEGRIVAATARHSVGQDVGHTVWFQQCKARLEEEICYTYTHGPGSRPALTLQNLPYVGFTIPLFDPQNRFLGTLHAAVKMEVVAEHIQDIRIGQSGGVLLVGSQGEVIADIDGLALSSLGNVSSLRSYRRARSGQAGIIREANLNGRDAFINFAPLGGPRGCLGWSILVTQDTDEIFTASRAQLKLSAAILLLGTLFILAGSFFLLDRGIAEPLRQLMEGVRAVCLGDLSHRVKVQGQDELGKLAEAFNQMGASLQEKGEALQAKSKELEGYIYTISHDLRSPLCSIQGYASLLAKEYQAALGEEGRRYLERIRGNVRQMEELIEGLLELSRAGRMSASLTYESSGRILKEVQEELSYQLEQEKARLVIGPGLPLIYCDRRAIHQVFANLIGNALSAVKERPCPTIEVGILKNGSSGCHFYVRDNGVGIDRVDHQRIFEPFQSLFAQAGKREGREERKGLGLAIVKRIIQAHGGEIWVESEPDRGAAFHFTLPESDHQK